jgi:hypothetical protein
MRNNDFKERALRVEDRLIRCLEAADRRRAMVEIPITDLMHIVRSLAARAEAMTSRLFRDAGSRNYAMLEAERYQRISVNLAEVPREVRS